jgi:nucleotide-binding universal stress UspA family protein
MDEKYADRPIVVGFDGSPHARLALRWAMDEAARLRAPLTIVYAIHWYPEFADVTSQETDRRVRDRARQIADDASAEATRLDPQLSVIATVASGHPVNVLADLSRGARMVVLGSRGHGGFAGLIAGSVSIAVATHAHCPVVVIRELPSDTADLPVAVGVDDSPTSRLAVEFAFAEALARGVPLLAVRAWRPPTPSSLATVPFVRAEEIAEIEAAESHFLHDIIGPMAARHHNVQVEERVIDQPAAAALTDIALKAQLMVVGSRGHGGFSGLLLGSVGMQLLHYARCPVAIVRESPTEQVDTP